MYYNYHINNLFMIESIYNLYLLYRCELFGIVGLQTNSFLMLLSNTFIVIEEEAIKTAKFMTKKRVCFLPKTPIKFNNTWILLAPNEDIMLSQKTRVRSISLIKDHKTSTTSSREVVYINLSPKEQYIAQQARRAYLASIY